MLQHYCMSMGSYKRLPTREVKVGDLAIGGDNPIRIQTMTTTDTMDTEGTVAQTIRCIEAGAELVRITAPSKKEAEQLQEIKKILRAKGYTTPLVADIHFTPNAAEIAARIVEKVRVNPGNYVDKKKFDFIEYTDAEYAAEVDRIRERFVPLVRICKEHGTAMRIGTNHGSLSDRIMSRYGDSPIGMVESAMEFLRIARAENYHQIVLSMKSSNPQVMVQAYRLLVRQMVDEFGECYPLHLGVTEAGDGEDGRIKSAIGIGTLLEDGIGDTIRVSLTEDPEFEIPVCKDIVSRYPPAGNYYVSESGLHLPYSPFEYRRRASQAVGNIGGSSVPVVVAEMAHVAQLEPAMLRSVGYQYDEESDKWNIADAAADYLYTGDMVPAFGLPGTLQVVANVEAWNGASDKKKCHPLLTVAQYVDGVAEHAEVRFVRMDAGKAIEEILVDKLKADSRVVLVLATEVTNAMKPLRNSVTGLMNAGVNSPVIWCVRSAAESVDKQLIAFATDSGGLLLDGLGDGVWVANDHQLKSVQMTGRTYLEVKDNAQYLNNTAFSILQATRTRISKTEYISCPSCGRTLFDLQETTAKIRAATHHLKGVKIAIMGCIVNGPGEMADADFGYVGSGPGKITLYKGKEVVKRNVPSEIAVNELIALLRENDAWVEMSA